MLNLTVRKRIFLSFSIILLVMGGLSLFILLRLANIKADTSHLSKNSLPGLYLINQIESLARHNYIIMLKHIPTENREEMQQYEAEMTLNTEKVDNYFIQYESILSDDKDRELLRSIVTARARYRASLPNVIELSRQIKKDEAYALMKQQLDPYYAVYMTAIKNTVEYKKQSGDRSAEDIQRNVVTTHTGLVVGLLLGLTLTLINGYALIQSINRPLAKIVSTLEIMKQGDFSQRVSLPRQDEFGVLANGLNLMAEALTGLIGQVQKSGIQVNSSATEIAASSKQQMSTSNEIAATTNQISATAKQISTTSNELVKTMKEVSDATENTAMLASSGQTGLTRMEATMRQIIEASGSINTRLSVLSDKASNINSVVTTITKVADQTNLLSLNAAIEAEKAGEYGRGFSVVATEIRRLADQTAVATYDIEQIVKEMQTAVSAGVMGMDKFSEEVRKGALVIEQVSSELIQIVNQVQKLTPHFEMVSEGMESQAMGAQQISEALVQLGETTQQTVDSLRQSNMAIEKLNDVTRGLQAGISVFKL
jgi:methyl-accepting chemotaxis protein WspA